MPDDGHRCRLLNRLASQIGRCHNPKDKMYKHYGMRGIRVCDQWRQDRRAFLKYVQTLPGWQDPSLDIDRIDNNGNYEPGNIRFSTKSENTSNRRRVEDLEARIRHFERWTETPIYDYLW
jgi:hypothetical protein